MNNHKRRLKTIELTLTPEQIVLLWHEAAKEAGTFSDGAWKPPAPRAAVANAVNSAIRKSMKGHPEPVVEKAIQQARKQADLLLMIIVQTSATLACGRRGAQKS